MATMMTTQQAMSMIKALGFDNASRAFTTAVHCTASS